MQDPIAELYAVAAALQFLETSFDKHDNGDCAVMASGAAYVTGLMGRRVDDIASQLAGSGDYALPSQIAKCSQADGKLFSE